MADLRFAAPATATATTAIDQLVGRLEQKVAGEAGDSERFYGYHPLPVTEFLDGLHRCGTPGGRFLDLGCGIGTKLLLAYHCGWDELVGVEHSPRLAGLARELVPEADIMIGDAFRIDCAGYAVVYTYRLCRSLELQHELGKHIVDTADPRTVVFYAGAELPVPAERLAESVWRV